MEKETIAVGIKLEGAAEFCGEVREITAALSELQQHFEAATESVAKLSCAMATLNTPCVLVQRGGEEVQEDEGRKALQ